MNTLIKYCFILFVSTSFFGCKKHVIKEYYPSGELEASVPIDEQGKQHGEAILYYRNGEVEKLMDFRHGIAEGRFRLYHNSGKLSISSSYKNGKQDGKYYQFYQNGNIKTIQNFRNDSTHGHVLIFDSLTSKLTSISHYFNGELCFFTNYDINGVITEHFEHFALLPLTDTLQKGEEYKFKMGQTGYHHPNVKDAYGKILKGKADIVFIKEKGDFYCSLKPIGLGELCINLFIEGKLEEKDGFFEQEIKFYVK